MLSERYLTLSLGPEHFAIPLLLVKEVLGMPDVTPVPKSPPYFLGIMNLRGQVISVLDLRLKLGMKAQKSAETVVIICDLDPYCLGIVVDSVNSVLSTSTDKILPKPDLAENISQFIEGVYQSESHLTLLLNLAKTLDLRDHAIIQKSSTPSTGQAARAA